ncbi:MULTISPECIES: cytochrome P450 [unclassified Streptomyces]|uniref:cytochrome P450 n=1 Tax=unclassified Streptomyces TaxID=2593676 RepID=UPI0036E85009
MKAELEATPKTLDSLDLTRPHLHAHYDLSAVWRLLRERRPVHWHPPGDGKPGFWVVTRYEDIKAAYRNPTTFGSSGGNVLDVMLEGGDSASGRMVSVSDGQYHSEIRSLLMKAFTPQALTRTAARVEHAVRRLVADAIEREQCDFAKEIAAAIPLQAICDLLGVSEQDRRFILEQTSNTVGSESPTATSADAWKAKNEILFYFAEMADRRRAEPAADVITMLVDARIRGRLLTDDEIIFNCYSLVLGGDETTRLAIVGGAHALAHHPDEWNRFRSGRTDLDPAIEEVLRWATPSMHQARLAREDVEWHGARIEEGDIVALWNVSGNRDERVFDRPDAFRLARTPNRHLTFAAGTHFCLGAHLARLEVAAVLRALRDMVCWIEPTGEPQPVFSNFLGGYSTLPVRLHPNRK